MQFVSRSWQRLVTGLAVALVVMLIVRVWVVPTLIVGQLQKLNGGTVTIRDWWLNFGSAGVIGLTLHEGPRADTPVWATVDRVQTDLSLGGLLLGRVRPRRIILSAPRLTFLLDRDGRLLNLPAFGGGGGRGETVLPSIVTEHGEVTFRPQGRPEMVVSQVDAGLKVEPRGAELTGRADDPTWGHWEARGTIDPDFRSGSIRLQGNRFAADRKTLERIAFVPPDVWAHVVPRGPVDVAVSLRWAPEGARPIETRAEVTFRETSARFPSLGLEAEATTGRIVVEDGLVRLDQVQGRAIGGRVAARGTLDFTRQPPRVALGLDLHGVNVVEAPRSWQLDKAGITGMLTGNVQVRALLKSEGVDLSGSTGEAVVEGGTVQGIPVKSLRLVMRADKDNLEFATEHKTGASSRRGPLLNLFAATTDGLVAGLVALQAPPGGGEPAAPDVAPRAEEPRKGGILFPRTITTRIELEDVDLAQLVSRFQFLLGFPFPLPIQGRLGLKADATIPLGQLRNLKEYAFHGDLTLSGASLARMDFGRLAARIDLADGVLELKDVRGRLTDHPSGGPDNPPPATAVDVPLEGPLPTGGFRGTLRAELSPPGALAARFEGNQLPVGELSAPFLIRPTPLSGLATLNLDGQADLARASDPMAWDVSGRAESQQITYRGTVLDRVALRFRLKDGKAVLPDLAATLKGQPLSARGSLDLRAPYSFDGTLIVTRWDLNSLVKLIPTAPHSAPVSGLLDAEADARGTLSPLTVQTQGHGQLGRFQAGPVPLGDVPFRWANEGDVIAIRVVEARPFGGRLAAEARVPLAPGKPTEGSAQFRGIDTALLAAAIPAQSLKLTGRADGRVTFAIPSDVSRVEANVQLDAPDLTVQGLPVENIRADVRAHQGTLKYELTADSLGGKVKVRGDSPLSAALPHPPAPESAPIATPAPVEFAANANVQAAGFALDQLWKGIGMTGMAAQVEGLGAIDANVRDVRSGPDAGLWLHGVAEFRNLSWGPHFLLGYLRGIVAMTPSAWRIDPISGEVLGGDARGFLWGKTPGRGQVQAQEAKRLGFELRLDHVPLKRALGGVPEFARYVDGSGTFRMAGTLSDSLRATADLEVPQGKLAGLPVRELRAPAELLLAPETGSGTIQIRRGSARLAGGQVHGDAWFRLGSDRSFHGDVQFAAIDLESISRFQSDARRPTSGRVSGRIILNGPSPSEVQRYRGKINLDLDDASLVYLPVFREIDRFLGSARGGLFEDGDLDATIANRQIIVEALTLEGRVAQLHATGTIGFDTQVNLDVLINTNQIIPQTGQALLQLVPGLADLRGRNEEAIFRFANFLSNRLLKLRVTGTIRNPLVNVDPGVVVADTAVAFFAGVLKMPLGLLK